MAGLVPAITDGYAFSFQTRFTNLVDQLVWNAFASNSDRLQALLFGSATHRGVEPLVRSGHTSTDAKVVTAIHAIAAALPFFLPEAAGAFCAAPAPCFLLRPTIGLEPRLAAKCGSPLDGYPGVPMADFDPEGGEWAVFPPEKAECLVAWHAEAASPHRRLLQRPPPFPTPHPTPQHQHPRPSARLSGRAGPERARAGRRVSAAVAPAARRVRPNVVYICASPHLTLRTRMTQPQHLQSTSVPPPSSGGTQWASTAGARAGPRTACRTQRDARSTTRRCGGLSRGVQTYLSSTK